MVELRRKNKPAPTEIKPPTNPEEWIERANADGDPPVAGISTELDQKTTPRSSRSVKDRARQKTLHPGDEMVGTYSSQSSVSSENTAKAPRKYISFAIDSISLRLFRELCFLLNKGNTETLTHIIELCVRLADSDFHTFPENMVVTGNVKRTMSFLLPQRAIEGIHTLLTRLRIRNKSALYRYLIQLSARKSGIEIKG